MKKLLFLIPLLLFVMVTSCAPTDKGPPTDGVVYVMQADAVSVDVIPVNSVIADVPQIERGQYIFDCQTQDISYGILPDTYIDTGPQLVGLVSYIKNCFRPLEGYPRGPDYNKRT